MAGNHYFDADEVRKAIAQLHPDNELFEVRLLHGRKNASGYFTDPDTLISELDKRFLQGWQCYVTLNQIADYAYARAQRDHFIDNQTPYTGDTDIERYKWFFVDADPERPSGISSTDAELAAAKAVIGKVHDYLMECGWPEPAVALSGNGYHLCYRLDMEVTDANKDLYEKALKALQAMFGNPDCKIDCVNYNPSRICKLWGTRAQKGADCPERPHRLSKLLRAGSGEIVTADQLAALANELPEEPQETPTKGKGKKKSGDTASNGNGLDLVGWMSEHGLSYRTGKTDKATAYYLDVCPFNADHQNGDARIFQYSDGAIAFKCHHNGCVGKRWQDVREKLEPGCYDDRQDGHALEWGDDSGTAAASDQQDQAQPEKDFFAELPAELRTRATAALAALESNPAYQSECATDKNALERGGTICQYDDTGDTKLIEAMTILSAGKTGMLLAEYMSRPKQNKIAPRFRKMSELEIHIAKVLEEQPLRIEPLQIISAAELKNMDLPPVQFVVDGLLPEGLSLLAGPPKYGKSWMSLDLCQCVATGGSIMGHRATMGAVLYLALEDSDRRLKSRMTAMQGKFPDRLLMAFTAGTLDNGLIPQLEMAMAAHPDIKLIVIDTLARVRGEMKARESVYQYDAREGAALQKFAMAKHISILVIHHTRKGGDDADIMNTISGSTGLTGIMDALLVMSRSNRGDTTTTLSVTGRDVESSDTVLQFDKEQLRWIPCGTVEDYNRMKDDLAYKRNPIVRTIRKRLDDNGGIYEATPAEIIRDCQYITHQTGATSTQALHKIIANFAEKLGDSGVMYELAKQKRKYTFLTAEYLQANTEPPDWATDTGEQLPMLEETNTECSVIA